MAGRTRTWLVDNFHVDRLVAPRMIADDYWMETRLSVGRAIRLVKWILDQCAVDYENLAILYAPLDEKSAAASANSDDLYFDPDDDRDAEEWNSTDDDFESLAFDSQKLLRFVRVGDLAYVKSLEDTTPVAVAYFNEEIKERSWNDAFVDACRFLCKDSRRIFERMRDDSESGADSLWLVGDRLSTRLSLPKMIDDGFWVETNLSVGDMARRLKRVLDRCKVDYENLTITYVRTPQTEEDEPIVPPTTFPRFSQEERAPNFPVAPDENVASDVERGADKHASEKYVDDDKYVDDEDLDDYSEPENRPQNDPPRDDYEFFDFTELPSIAFTKPIFLQYFGRKFDVNSWRNLFVVACRLLYEDNSELFEIIRDDCIAMDARPLISDAANKGRQTMSTEIAPGYFAETNFSAPDLMKKLRGLMIECAVDCKSVVVAYESTGVVRARFHRPASRYSKRDKRTFRLWLKEVKDLDEADVDRVVSTIERAEAIAVEQGLYSTRLFTSKVKKAKETALALYSDPTFNMTDEWESRSLRASISLLFEFYAYRAPVPAPAFEEEGEEGFDREEGYGEAPREEEGVEEEAEEEYAEEDAEEVDEEGEEDEVVDEEDAEEEDVAEEDVDEEEEKYEGSDEEEDSEEDAVDEEGEESEGSDEEDE